MLPLPLFAIGVVAFVGIHTFALWRFPLFIVIVHMSLLWLLLLVAAKLLLSLYAIVVALVVYVVFIVFTFVADAHNVGVIVGCDVPLLLHLCCVGVYAVPVAATACTHSHANLASWPN